MERVFFIAFNGFLSTPFGPYSGDCIIEFTGPVDLSIIKKRVLEDNPQFQRVSIASMCELKEGDGTPGTIL